MFIFYDDKYDNKVCYSIYIIVTKYMEPAEKIKKYFASLPKLDS